MDFRDAQECEEQIYWSRMPWTMKLRLGWQAVPSFLLVSLFFSQLVFAAVCFGLLGLRALLGVERWSLDFDTDNLIASIDGLGRNALGLSEGSGLKFYWLVLAILFFVLLRGWWNEISPWATKGRASERARRAKLYRHELFALRDQCRNAIEQARCAAPSTRVAQVAKWIRLAEPFRESVEAHAKPDGSAVLIARLPESDSGGRPLYVGNRHEMSPCIWIVMPSTQIASAGSIRAAVTDSLREYAQASAKGMPESRVRVIGFEEAPGIEALGRVDPKFEYLGPAKLCLLIAGREVWAQREAVMTRHHLPWIEARSILCDGACSADGFDFTTSDRLSQVRFWPWH